MDLEEELENALSAEWRAWQYYYAAKRATPRWKKNSPWLKKARGIAHAASGKVAWLRSQATR
jgi:hypothetical protein